MTVILVTGGRDANESTEGSDWQLVDANLRRYLQPGHLGAMVIEGGARGFDTLCRRWCEANTVHYATVPALWRTTSPSRAAGPRRNTAMLNLHKAIDFVMAFPGGRGTADMVAQAEAFNLRIIRITHQGATS